MFRFNNAVAYVDDDDDGDDDAVLSSCDTNNLRTISSIAAFDGEHTNIRGYKDDDENEVPVACFINDDDDDDNDDNDDDDEDDDDDTGMETGLYES